MNLTFDDKEVKIDKKKEKNELAFLILSEIHKKVTKKSLNLDEFKKQVSLDIPGSLETYIIKNIGEDSESLKILRTITQHSIAPFIVKKKLDLNKIVRFKDAGWEISVNLSKKKTVTHKRTESSYKIYPDDYAEVPENTFKFIWTFEFEFNDNYELVGVTTKLEKDFIDDDELVMKFYPDEIKCIKENFLTKATYSYLEIKAPEKTLHNERIKVELDIKELSKVTEYSWIGLYEVGKSNSEYISYIPTPLGDVIGQPKSTIQYLMPSVSGEFEFRFFTSEYKRSHSSKLSKNKIVCGYHTTTSKLLEGWQKGSLDEVKPKKLRFNWVISGYERFEEKNVEEKKKR